MKIVSWNVNGIRAAWGHGLSSFLDSYDANIYAFQETKTNETIPMMELPGYFAYWSFCRRKKGYSGTFCLTKIKPINVFYTLDDKDFDVEGRIITLEFEKFYFINCYVPNSQGSEKRHDYREKWDYELLEYLKRLKELKPIVVCGDFNVAISEEEVYKENERVELDDVGFQSIERENLIKIVENGFVDAYRFIHPNEREKYSWWSNRKFKRKENKGWRLDYFFVSEDVSDKIKESTLLTEIQGSDHCPIILEIDIIQGIEKIQKIKEGIKYKYEDLLKLEQDNIPIQDIKNADYTNLWDSINWENAEKNLETMQMALAKSAYTKDLGLIKKWQKKIVYSIDAKILAVRHVCSTTGGGGVDKIKWSTSHEKMIAAISLNSKGYKAMPSRLLLVKSKNGKQRRIHIETYYDKAMQCLYAYALDPVAESWGDRKSFAYRKGRSTYDMNEYIKYSLSGDDAPEWVFIGDVRKCYENISHEWIKKNIPMAENVLNEFLEAGYVYGGSLFPTDVGVGIGCSISPIVANMTLDGLQKYIYSRLQPFAEKIDYGNGDMLRYADDIIIAARSKESAEKIKGYVKEFLKERGLELSEEKSKIINIYDGFTFMSRTYVKKGNQIYVTPSESAIERFMSNMKDTIENYKGSQKSLIEKINQKIDGWATYHKVGESEDAFRRIDVYISALLLKLCEDKHPKWSRKKIIEKYWYFDTKGRPCYALTDKKEVRVKFLADTLLIDYFAIKTNVNPYIDIKYVEQRLHEREILNVTGVYRSIWNRQEGKCHYCGHKILKDEEKMLIEVDAGKRKLVSRMAYIHKRCSCSSFDYIDTDLVPTTQKEMLDLLETLENSEKNKKNIKERYLPLADFFRTCDKYSVTLTFKEIEKIMGEPLGATSLRSEYWYRTGFTNISQCWLENGYEIKALHLEDKKRVVFHLTDKNKEKSSVNIPEIIKYGRIPNDAKYELENYFKYIIKKYGL